MNLKPLTENDLIEAFTSDTEIWANTPLHGPVRGRISSIEKSVYGGPAKIRFKYPSYPGFIFTSYAGDFYIDTDVHNNYA